MYCRGCFAVARCNRALVLVSSISRPTSTSARPPTSATPNECSGGSTCTVRNCCPAVRAIAIFEALSAFDDSFVAEAGFRSEDRKGKSQSKEYRDAYVRQIIGGKPAEKDKAQGNGARRFEDAFVRALKAVSAWLQAPNSDANEDYPSKGKDAEGHAVHATIPRLFETSLLLEVIHVFLGNTNVRDWVAHAETYLAILDLLRWMLDASTAISLLRAPIRRIEATSGLRRAVWGDGNVRFEDIGGAAFDPAAPAPGRERTRSLCDLIKNLEAHRRPLMALASKATFEATVDKVNSLCDGILYLLLQQVVDEI
ncbi:hypothetical protein HYPSUDRAFT_1086661 [Hypholoma sublateritium FD-334 SS-4]|uniref:Uncharacterized protein n=1 Tax=Hypholoma sublateritium (strain FD-334 SS-4) TaxID=945553 RepID=A0A0D2PBT6_HYPSF|nr:hypothetical protein HYPSUDRAFT_1086661 [Hypholoma sublateritium FD-334 SS-4]